MSHDEAKRNHTKIPEDQNSPSRDDFDRFRHLTYELLKYSTQGLLRREFLPMVTERIRAHSGSDAVELWVKEDPSKHFRCSVTRSKKMPFGFILVPCPLGEETSPAPEKNELDIERICCDVINGSLDGLGAHLTERGSFWVDDSSVSLDLTGRGNATSPLRHLSLPSTYKSFAIIPIRLEKECIGVLQLKSKETSFFTVKDVDFYEDISEILGVALSHQYAQIELRERIKETTCLFGIARVVAQPDATFPEVIQDIVNLLPKAWLLPEIACARVVLNGQSFETDNFRESQYCQVSDVVVRKKKIGFVEVAYLEKTLTLDEGPFLAEERNLIDSVAREVAIFCERIGAEEEKVSLQDQLRHADRLATIGQLAAGVAHELNEPLGNILGFAQLAMKSPELPVQVEKDLKNIESASLHAREIIKKLMAFARQLPPKKVPVSLNDIVNEGVYFFEARCIKADIHLVCRLDANLPKITVDPGQVNQVLVNLAVNAIQAMPSGGTLTVETRATEEGVCLVVEDTGSGMDDNLADRIFLPFFTTKDVDEGTGLGLAVVHGIVTAHGGRIDVETELGKGARFMVHLPFSKTERFAGRKE